MQPAAGHTRVLGVHGDALKIKVAAPPVDGKANDALLQFFAEVFGVPLRQVTLVRGQTSRAKVVRVNAPMVRPDPGWT